MSSSGVSIRMLIAGNGDCFVISFKDEAQELRNILIDGGNGKTVFEDHLLTVAEKISDDKQQIDLLVISHIDQDHIKGIIYLTRAITGDNEKLKEESVARYWFNSALAEKVFQKERKSLDVSAAEMRELEKFLHNQRDERWDIKELIFSPAVKSLHGATITILSPNEEILNTFIEEFKDLDIGTISDDYDRSLEELYEIEKKLFQDGKEDLDDKLENASSIAFLFEHNGASYLHLGDGIPLVIDKAIQDLIASRDIDKLKVDAVKLSHHASRKSISFKFLQLVSTTKYLVSANGKKARLPNKATFAKILLNEYRDKSAHIEFYFNYPDFAAVLKFTDEEYSKWNFSCHDANFEHGYFLPL